MTFLLTLTAILSGAGTIILLWPGHGFLAVLVAPMVASACTGTVALIGAGTKVADRRRVNVPPIRRTL
jgi:hypothetical protein